MAIEDYIAQYESTSFCVRLDPKLYQHNLKAHDFAAFKATQACFKFSLSKTVDCRTEIFAISINQQGDRLGKYR